MKSMLNDLGIKSTRIMEVTAMVVTAQTLFLKYYMRVEVWISMEKLVIIGIQRIGIIMALMFPKIQMIKNPAHHLGLELINLENTGQ
ncbi:hypothetical protein D478_00890 [Brevibacillus agri BAB-2500]|nr:hypothetical protein D478_00890 [Brevibacillus agri BAB-2500]